MNGRLSVNKCAQQVLIAILLLLTISIAFIGTSIVQAADFADAPDSDLNKCRKYYQPSCEYHYPTLEVNNGARHLNTRAAWLGNSVSDETAPKSSDDDDFLSTQKIYNATWNGSLYINVLIDHNSDGDWDDPGEWVVQNNSYDIPKGKSQSIGIAGPPPGKWYRITLTGRPVTAYTGKGIFSIGETEDYLIGAQKKKGGEKDSLPFPPLEFCGDGIINLPGEQCDPPGGGCPAGLACNINCLCDGEEGLPPIPGASPGSSSPGLSSPGSVSPDSLLAPQKLKGLDRITTGSGRCRLPWQGGTTPCDECIKGHAGQNYAKVCYQHENEIEKNRLHAEEQTIKINLLYNAYNHEKNRLKNKNSDPLKGIELRNIYKKWAKEKPSYDRKIKAWKKTKENWKQVKPAVIEDSLEMALKKCKDEGICGNSSKQVKTEEPLQEDERCTSLIKPKTFKNNLALLNEANRNNLGAGKASKVLMNGMIAKAMNPYSIILDAKKIGSRSLTAEFDSPGKKIKTSITKINDCDSVVSTGIRKKHYEFTLIIEKYEIDKTISFFNPTEAIINIADLASAATSIPIQLTWISINGAMNAIDKEWAAGGFEVLDFAFTAGGALVKGSRAVAEGGKAVGHIGLKTIKKGSKTVVKSTIKQRLKSELSSSATDILTPKGTGNKENVNNKSMYIDQVKSDIKSRLDKNPLINTVKAEKQSILGRLKRGLLGEHYIHLKGTIEIPVAYCIKLKNTSTEYSSDIITNCENIKEPVLEDTIVTGDDSLPTESGSKDVNGLNGLFNMQRINPCPACSKTYADFAAIQAKAKPLKEKIIRQFGSVREWRIMLGTAGKIFGGSAGQLREKAINLKNEVDSLNKQSNKTLLSLTLCMGNLCTGTNKTALEDLPIESDSNCPDCGIELVQVIAGRGNNPLSPTDPVSAGTTSTIVDTPATGGGGVSGDTIPPVISAPASITVAATDMNGISVANATIQAFLAAATATDNVAVVGSVTNNAPLVFPVLPNMPTGNTTNVIFSAVDAVGNIGTSTSSVTVVDQSAPGLTLPTSITVTASSGATSVPASNATISTFLNAAQALDDVDGMIAAPAVSPPANFSVGTTTVTFKATDGAGNVQTGTRTVTVLASAGLPAIIDGRWQMTCDLAFGSAADATTVNTLMGTPMPSNPMLVITGNSSNFVITTLPPGDFAAGPATENLATTENDLMLGFASTIISSNGHTFNVGMGETWTFDFPVAGQHGLQLSWQIFTQAPDPIISVQYNCSGNKAP
ncbi:MAG: HYR domain-containing protein [Gammaproteobacteria bacterium]|nr:HYR domain-containing protein [Gammaproteobacteria bacterium]